MKIRWKRQSIDGEAIPEVDEGSGWVHYKESELYVPDNSQYSHGYLTFLACIKAGYEVIKKVE